MDKINVPTNSESFFYRGVKTILKINNSLFGNPSYKKVNNLKPNKKEHSVNFLTKNICSFEETTIASLKTYIFNKGGNKTLVYFHGGAYMNKPLHQHYSFLEDVSKKTNFKIYMIIYPKIPEFDCEKSISLIDKWLCEIPEKEIYLGGDSSGGALAIVYTKRLYEGNTKKVLKSFSLSPWMDTSLTNSEIENFEKIDVFLNKKTLQKCGKLWQGNLDPKNYLHSPVNIKNFVSTPLLIISGKNEILTPDIALFCNNNADKNILWYEYDKMGHCFALYPCKEKLNPRQKIVDFLTND